MNPHVLEGVNGFETAAFSSATLPPLRKVNGARRRRRKSGGGDQGFEPWSAFDTSWISISGASATPDNLSIKPHGTVWQFLTNNRAKVHVFLYLCSNCVPNKNKKHQ